MSVCVACGWVWVLLILAVGSQAYIGWLWEAADWLAVTLNRATVQWMHHKAQHALLQPVLQYQSGEVTQQIVVAVVVEGQL